jgi:HJR/Mrr/RecB family endonuclease
MKSINEIQLDDKFEQQLQLHEEMFDAYAKVERISHPHLSNSRNRLREDMIYFVLVSEEGHLEKGEAIELIKIAEGMEEFVSFSEAHNPEYTEITIEHLIDQIRLAVDENNYNIMSEGIEKMHTIKKSVWELDDLYEYSWSDFEYLIANLWKSKGYDTHIGSQVADKGIDVTATKENEDIAIQVKQFSQDNKVGSRVIRNTGGVLPRGFDKVVVVTSSSFTSPAKDEATDYGDGMELINGHELVQELNDSNLTPPAE